jgi:4-amino-4-deoxy-L-arabinose transferase-like glycosyltransferase
MPKFNEDEYYNLFFGKVYGLFRVLTNPVFLAILGAILLSLSTISYSMSRDEGIWSYIARVWADNGLVPYTHTVDNKPTGIISLYYISHILFGVNFWFPRLMGIIASMATSLCLYWLIRRLSNHISAIIGMVFYICVVPTRHFEGAFTAHTETFMVLGVVAAFLLVALSSQWQGRKRSLGFCGAGLAVGVAITFKQIALLDCLALLFFAVFMLKPQLKSGWELTKILAIILFCALAVNILSVLPIVLSGGGVGDYFNMVWIGLLHGREMDIPLAERLTNILSAWRHNFMIVPLIGAVGFITHRKRLQRLGLPVGALLIWLALAFTGVNAAGTYYGHQFRQILPPLSVMYGIFFGFLAAKLGVKGQAQTFFKTSEKIALGFILLTMLYYIPFNSQYENAFSSGRWNNKYKKLGLYVKKISEPGQYVYFFGEGQDQALSYSNRLAPSPYFNELFLAYPDAVETAKRDIIENNTDFILLDNNPESNREAPAWLQNIVDNYYAKAETYGDYEIFILKDRFENGK